MSEKIDAKAFQEKVLQGGGPVVVDFSADWCGPCKKLAVVLAEMASRYQGKVEFYEVDAGVEVGVAQQCNVMSLPTTLFYRAGKEMDRLVGLVSKDKIQQRIDKLLV